MGCCCAVRLKKLTILEEEAGGLRAEMSRTTCVSWAKHVALMYQKVLADIKELRCPEHDRGCNG